MPPRAWFVPCASPARPFAAFFLAALLCTGFTRLWASPSAGAVPPHAKPTGNARLLPAPLQAELPPPPAMRYVPGLEEPLVATGPVTPEENRDLTSAIAVYSLPPQSADEDFAGFAQPFLAYVSAHPSSAWNSAIFLNLGIGYYHAGYFSRALDAWQKAWDLGRDATSPQARIMVDRAAGELARMHARLGHKEELEKLLAQVDRRPIGGPATEMIKGAHEGLWAFEHDPGIAYLCGPAALEKLLIALNARADQIQVADEARSGPHGFSLAQLADLADKTQLKYKLIHRQPGQPIPVPSIINWKLHHYAAITGKQGSLYQVIDPTFGGSSGALLTANAIDTESSGYFLVPDSVFDSSPASGWRVVADASDEARSVYGMGKTGSDLPGTVMTTDVHGCGGDTPSVDGQKSSSCPQNNGSCSQQPSCGAGKGLTTADVVMMPVSLYLVDTPVGYRPQKGPNAQVTLFYNQREDQQPATFSFSNIGPKWTFSWLAYIQDDPNNPGNAVSRYASGGGGIVNQAGGYNRSTGTFIAETYDNAQLVRIPPTGPATSYERRLPDGSTEVYGLSNGAQKSPRIMFLTQVLDPAGNAATLQYDSQFRLTSVTDAMGRSTTFSYDLAQYPLLITRITDAFGRSSQLTYDANQRLASITDPIGITSSFTYSATEPTFITRLKTPYGTSVFSDALPTKDPMEGNTRALTLTDPLGYTDYYYFYEHASFFACTDSSDTVPGLNHLVNAYLCFRNTYYYDKHAFNYPGAVTLNGDGSVATEDPTKSHVTHWVHDQLNFPSLTGRVAESIKPPLEGRTWYTYPNQPSGYESGYLDRPNAAGRVIVPGDKDHLVQERSYATYNGGDKTFGGRPTSVTDAVGRQTSFTYASNRIDLLTVQQNTSGGLATIATFSNYNNQHEPQSYTGADGRSWQYTYNPAGQLTSVIDPNNGITSYSYDGIGRLSTVQNANRKTVLTLTYDSADRVRTRTDSEGYTLTYDYDNLDRVTKITYPDGTTDLYDWNFQSGPLQGTPSLDLRKHIDRLGRVTTYDYDADRRLIAVTEPISNGVNRTTRYDYYENGVLKDLIDANGNVTHWDIDLESRPVSKTYAYGTQNAETETITYEDRTSRVASLVDALGQMKNYSYGLDDRLTGITYMNAANPTPNVSFAWDQFFPRLASMVDGTGATSYSYVPIGSDGALQLASSDGPFNNDTIAYSYDALGRMSARNIPGGNESFGYDAISRLVSHGTPLGTFSYQYLGQTDQVTSRSLPNGIGTSWNYDINQNDRRLIRINNSGLARSYILNYGSGSSRNPYDILSITDIAPQGHPFKSAVHGYSYDLSDRLLGAVAPTVSSTDNHSYGYDLLDNITTSVDGNTKTQATYNALNEIVTWGSNNYFYDANGNLLSGDGKRTYKWDAENRLVEIDHVGSTAKTQFIYDALGRRAIAIETANLGGTTTSRFLWCGGRLCQTRDSGDTALRRDLGEGELNVSTGRNLIYMPDQLGSVRDVLDARTGNLVQSYDYTPYGGVARSNGNTPTDYQYANLFYHPSSGLNLSATRAMDGSTGRWLNRDPINEIGGINLYEYGDANTVNLNDPEGLLAGEATCADPLQPFCWFSVGQDMWSIYKTLSTLMSVNQSAQQALQRQKEYERAKNYCDTPPEEGANECSTLSRQIDRAENCINLYEQWDARWSPGRHSDKIDTWRQRLKNLKEEHRSKCTQKCP